MANKTTDFGELSKDEQFKERISNFEASLEDITKLVDGIVAVDVYERLSADDKVRTQGKDPNQGDLKNELNRVKEYMTKSRKLYERKHVMPRLDKGAAGRFIRSGLWEPTTKNPEESTEGVTQATKRKREDSEGES